MAKALCKIMDSFLTNKIFLCLFYFFILSREESLSVSDNSSADIPGSVGGGNLSRQPRRRGVKSLFQRSLYIEKYAIRKI